jgi:hypothetical protein
MPTVKLEFNSNLMGMFQAKTDLEQALYHAKATLESENPILILTHENGNMLLFGISAEGCFVNYKDVSWDPPYYSSAGDPEFANETGVTVFYIDGHNTEISTKQLIKFPDLISVILYFFEHGTHPAELIDWVED